MYDSMSVAIRVIPSFGHPARLVVQPSRVTPALDLKFQRRFYLCHSTRSVNTPSVNPGPADPPFLGPRGPGPAGLARPVRVCARALDRGVGPSGMTIGIDVKGCHPLRPCRCRECLGARFWGMASMKGPLHCRRGARANESRLWLSSRGCHQTARNLLAVSLAKPMGPVPHC